PVTHPSRLARVGRAQQGERLVLAQPGAHSTLAAPAVEVGHRIADQEPLAGEERAEPAELEEDVRDARGLVVLPEVAQVGDQIRGGRLAEVLLAAAAEKAQEVADEPRETPQVALAPAPCPPDRDEAFHGALDRHGWRSRGWQRSWTCLRSVAATCV